MHLLYLNTLAFLCYDFTLQTKLKVLPYWCMLAGFGLIAMLNNFHGYHVMNTTAGSFNTKFYFFTRSLLQGLYIYLSLTLVANKTLAWGSVSYDEDKSEILILRIICAVVSIFSIAIYVALLTFASRLIKIQNRTEFDIIRNADNTMYEEVNASEKLFR